ncbi:MAG: peptide-binding protein [candidate division KSB1 bacterium]|nr:peptide-binding protein [candidate division KSB1 bacterium]MDZ7364748.1 peptide-binding protein [candidate division KSB1 bacterium]MDZ7402504.1 peptide-binding protein [candidate division KSB1 bacterium]
MTRALSKRPTNACPSFYLIYLFIFLVFIGCSKRNNSQLRGTVIIGTSGDFDSFNELNAASSDALQAIQYLLFMSLTTLDENLQFAPQLAAAWEFAPGDTLLTFHLRKDVFWTDGVPTTAHDVLFTYLLAIDTTVAYPAASRFDQTAQVEVIDDFTVRFHFKRPYPDALFDTQMPILPKHLLEKIPRAEMAACEFNRKPVGNGPFKLVEWQANQRVVFEANPNYALGRPKLDRLVFQIIPEETVLMTNLLTGKIDMISSLTPLAFKQAEGRGQGAEGDSPIRTIRYPGRNYAFIGWNNARPLFTRRVRQALTMAINKNEIINTLLEGYGQPAIGPLLPFNWAYDKDLRDLPFDPAAAQNLLRQEGWQDTNGDGILDKQGKKLEFSLKTNADNQLRRDIAVMVQAQLKKIGVQANVEAVEWNLLLQQVFEQRDFDALISAWDADFAVNPSPLWHTAAIANGYNIVSYRNARIDSLLDRARAIADRRVAAPLWHEFQKIIVEDSPYTFLFAQERLAAMHRRVQNVKMDVRSWLVNIGEWQIENDAKK